MEFGKDITTDELTEHIKGASRAELTEILQESKNIKILAEHLGSVSMELALTAKLSRPIAEGAEWRDAALCYGLEKVYLPDETHDTTKKNGELDSIDKYASENLGLTRCICGRCPVKVQCQEFTERNPFRNRNIYIGETPDTLISWRKVRQKKARKLKAQSTSMASPNE